MRSAVTLIFLTLFSLPALAKGSFGDVEVSRVVSVYDGDTFRVDIDHWPALVGENAPIRVNRVDTPEIRGKCPYEKTLAKAAKIFTQAQLAGAKLIELRNIQRGKYFRIIADVYIDNVSLAQLLIDANLARPYQGGKRRGWCD